MNAKQRLVCVVGATGNQGGSVARRFLAAGFQVRGLTRNPSSTKAQQLADLGIDVVQADLGEVDSLIRAFKGAHVIFSVTDYWEPFFKAECRQKAADLGISCRRFAYDVEYQYGINIAEAAATTEETLAPNGFLVSTLSHARKCSNGVFKELYHFDSKADVFPYAVQQRHPALAAKMSCIQTGYFYTSFRILPDCYFHKLPDGSVQTTFTTDPDKPVPHLDPVGDMGNFTYAVYQMPHGLQYMAEGTTCSWTEWIGVWGKITGTPVSYRQVGREEMISLAGADRDTGIEVADMFSYSSDPGYDGGESLIKAADIEARGISCHMTSWKDWASRQDWSQVINQKRS